MSATKKIFWEDPYQIEHISTVVAVNGNNIELDETIFFAESGGQESDKGTIGGIEVIKAEKIDKKIIYTLEHAPNFKVGDRVETAIDWNRRYKLMRLHFAAEIVLELFYKKFAGIKKIGAHIAEDKSRLDFEMNKSVSEFLPEFTNAAQALIDADLNVESNFSDIDAERRYWKIEGFAQVSCGGTHIKKTAEVGKIKLKRNNIGKGKERVEITIS